MDILIFGVALSAYYTLHSFLASQNIKSVLRNLLVISNRGYRLFFNLIAVFSTLGMIMLFNELRPSVIQEEIKSFPMSGCAFVAIGLVLIIWSMRYYDILEFSGFRDLQHSNKLNTFGPNRFIRHPLYLGILLVMVGWNLIVINGLAATTLIITLVYVFIGIHLEEKKLINQFGESYETYRKTVPKLWPKWQLRN
ncbi:MAG: isoprenylcysteine carboxylmethyltransferase family protein [Bacteroidia bacterium]|nr:isoprenylcysteine carboxylmethyltransferase family protein [Bacteroidia bacterium]